MKEAISLMSGFTNRGLAGLGGAVLASHVLGIALAPADIVLSQWVGGTNANWGTAANWNPAVVPNNGGGSTYSVSLDDGFAGQLVNINISPTIESLSILGATILSLDNSRQLAIRSGPIVNEGVFRLNSTGTSTILQIGTVIGSDVVQLTGGGVVILNESTGNRIVGAASTNRLVNEDNLIRGGGRIGLDAMRLTNRGVVRADSSIAELQIDPRPGLNGVVNTGVMEAIDEGVLRLQGGEYNNQAGLIRASDLGVVLLENANIGGGSVEVEGTGRVATIGGSDAISRLDDLVLQIDPGGVVQVDNRSELQLGSGGTYLNAGEIRLTGSNWPTTLRIVGDEVFLAGGGVVAMSASINNRISGLSNAETRFVNVDNIIRGAGDIGRDQLRFTNHGVVRADTNLAELFIDPRAGLDGVINTGV
jgi:hypothetical protein